MSSVLTRDGLAVASGVFAHVAVFRRGEWDVAAPSVFAVYFLVFASALGFAYTGFLGPQFPSYSVIAQLEALHVAGIYTSMLLYRAFFHRLRKYPGPFLARLTNFYITARSMKKLHLFEEVQKLHEQYGDYVRLGKIVTRPRTYSKLIDLSLFAAASGFHMLTLSRSSLGPSELSIAEPEAVKAIYGSQSPCTKGPWYTLLEPRVPLFMARDKQEHARRRKVWDQGFTTKGSYP